jgi:LuxR family transcriptional regulator, maltose regulon positive regulatory protein
MAQASATVQGDMLFYQHNGQDSRLTVGSPDWYEWLKIASPFAFTCDQGTFTARAERAGNRRGGWYWKAYCAQGGKLHRAYLGKPEDMTLERLTAVAQALATACLSPTGAVGHSEQLPQSSHRVLQQEPFLTTKLSIPPARSDSVPRPRLIDRLNGMMQRKLTLVSAPAGFGKTTLLSAWCAVSAKRYRHIGWVSLDASDNDPTRFWSYVIAALAMASSGLEENILMLLRSPQPPPIESILVIVINKLTTIPHEIALILDDYHLIETPAVHDALVFLIDHLSPNLHVVVASRVDPPLPVARLRTQGHLAELRITDLRFTPAEAASFLNGVVGLDLTADDIAALEAKTEGWIAGLHLAALALQERSDRAGFVAIFTGRHRYVLDYLVDEVLQHQSEFLQTFLLQTSILDRLSGPLCDVVTDSTESDAVLQQLERSNLFLVPLDEERSWYRYHHLFGEVLQSRLKQMHPSRIAELHIRAAGWYERNGLVVDAVRHALAAADFAYAVQLIELTAEIMMKQSEITTLLNWLRALPAGLLRTQPRLSLFHAWALTSINQLDAAEVSLQDAERVLLKTVPQSLTNSSSSTDERRADIQQLPGEVAAIRASIASLRGDVPRTIECARLALERLPHEKMLMRGMTTLSLGRAYLWSGDLEAAENVLAEAWTINQLAGNLTAALISRYSQGHLSVMQGRLRQAAKIYRTILDDLAKLGDVFPIASLVHIGMGDLLFEWYQLKAAEEHLLQGIELGKQWGSAGSLLHGFMCLALIKLAGGDFNGALMIQQEVEQAVERDNLPYMRSAVRAFRVRIELIRGNSEMASNWIQEVADNPLTFPSDFERLTLARAYLAAGKYAEARRVLEPLLREAAQRSRSIVEGLILLALALRGQNEIEQARATLTQALALAEPEGYVSTFVIEGQPMAALLTQVHDAQKKERPEGAQRVSPRYIRILLAVLKGETLPLPKDTAHLGAVQLPGEPIESLSEREREVLQCLAAGMSNQAMAQEFIVSVGTIKTHLNNIYGKLNVHSRTQAVARARALHLLV